jgi:hypothetical protein
MPIVEAVILEGAGNLSIAHIIILNVFAAPSASVCFCLPVMKNQSIPL